MPDFDIRAARTDDAERISAIYNEAVLSSTATFDTTPETAAERLVWLAQHDAPRWPVLVAVEGGAILGWGSLSRYSDRCAYEGTAEISTYVTGGHTGRGIGTTLARTLLEAGAKNGIHAVVARICTENASSLAMAERLGFERVGVLREVGRKFERWLDVAILERLS
jgi:phosphinothricin acetyltransferase